MTEPGRQAEEAYMTPEEVSEMLRIAPGTLRNLRHRGGGPTYVKLGRVIRYRRSDVLTWARRQTRDWTGE